ncbi:MAG TPA: hypothetical protein VNK44_03995 [Candidatus Nitrosotenuis sp.]|nr:hypothetical protein [Candidatus Nitrosotenuis sp.]
MYRLLVASLVFLLLPFAPIFGQLTETPSTLGVKLTSTAPFSYKDEEGYTVVLGEVENTKTFPVKNVKIWVGFYSSKAAGSGGTTPLETVTGTTLLDVVPAKGKSPFIIKSKSPNPEISEVTINVLGFNSAAAKQQALEIKPQTLTIGDLVVLPASITNGGQTETTSVKVHLIAYDAFVPPRIVGIETVEIDELGANESKEVEFSAKIDYRATSFKVIAESDEYQSKVTDISKVSLDTMTRLVSINNVEVRDIIGDRVSEIRVGETVNISSDLTIQYSALTKPSQPYVYYAQVKQFGEKATVEFIGIFEGQFGSAGPQRATVEWTPQNEGGFFIETYVWDPDGVPLAAPSKTVSIVLVTP